MILVGQKENLVAHKHKVHLKEQNVRPGLQFRRTLAKFGPPLSDDRLLFAALAICDLQLAVRLCS